MPPHQAAKARAPKIRAPKTGASKTGASKTGTSKTGATVTCESLPGQCLVGLAPVAASVDVASGPRAAIPQIATKALIAKLSIFIQFDAKPSTTRTRQSHRRAALPRSAVFVVMKRRPKSSDKSHVAKKSSGKANRGMKAV